MFSSPHTSNAKAGILLLTVAVVFTRVASAQAVLSDRSNIVIDWNNAALQGVRDSKIGAPMIARALAIVHTCMYDAWAAYDEQAVGTQLHDALRCPLASPAQQERVNVAFVDKSLPGSPIGVSGQVSLREAVVGNQVESSWIERVVVKNISRKPFLMFVVSLTLIGRHNRGALRGPGDGPTYVLSDDRFFAKTLIQPDESLVLRDTKPEEGEVECCINPLEKGSDPRAEFRVRFAQFADGSSFGDREEAKDELAVRATIVSGLRKLFQSYSERGEQGFLTELERNSPWSATVPFADLRATYKETGVGAAIARAQQILSVAENHEASIRGPDAR